MRVPRPFAFATLGLLLVAGTASAKKPVDNTAAFVAVAEANFATWDLNHDGKLQSDEVDRRIGEPGLKGKEAAAIVSIKSMQRKYLSAKKELFEPTLEQLKSGTIELASSADETAGGHGKTVSLGSGYASALKRLPEVNRNLYAKDGPDFSVMSQGPVGDCFLFSCLGYLAKNSPERIRSMIGEIPDGYTVKLGGEAVKVGPLSDAGIVLNNAGKSIGDGLWLPILEQAIGVRFRATSKKPVLTKEASDAIASGGSPGRVIEAISGHKAVSFNLRKPARNAKDRDFAAELREIVPPALADKRILVVSMPKTPRDGSEKIPFLGYNHAYAIMGYDAKTDTLTLWNPWGNTKTPAGTPGVQNGYPTTHGLFYIPLTTVVHEFGTVSYEPKQAVLP